MKHPSFQDAISKRAFNYGIGTGVLNGGAQELSESMQLLSSLKAFGAFILGDTLLMSLMKDSPTGGYMFAGFFTPDVSCSDRRISSKFAQVVGPILLYVAGYEFPFIIKQLKRMEAKMGLANNHRLWKPHSLIKQLIEKGKIDCHYGLLAIQGPAPNKTTIP